MARDTKIGWAEYERGVKVIAAAVAPFSARRLQQLLGPSWMTFNRWGKTLDLCAPWSQEDALAIWEAANRRGEWTEEPEAHTVLEPDHSYHEKGLQLRLLGARVTYDSGVQMILTCKCRNEMHRAGVWRAMLALGPTGLATQVRAYGGDVYWTRDQVLYAWTMMHHRTHDNHWSELAGQEIVGSNCSCAAPR